ncbi:MAG: filamentous hemagglutinin N-terminal domain-containing protein [Desulfobulbaceae bacterium]|nr:filamentous hemagglutinin N-terminal domain-containing protein [Desulfobulbaceae bacterium]
MDQNLNRCAAVLLCFFCQIAIAQAEVVLDGSVGVSDSLSGPDYEISADLGQQMGSNLFHSFTTFNIDTGESALFTGPDSVENIVGRVTGGSESWIDGLISSNISGANLYLLNPAGVIFGPNASLDLSGSFHVSTADYLQLGDNGVFYSDRDNTSVLTVASPTSFGFLTENPEAISATGSFLAVPKWESLTFSGGNITLDNANLYSQGGQISLTSIDGTIEINRDTTPPYYNSEMLFADIETGGMEAGHDGGGVYISGGNLLMSGASIRTDTYSEQDSIGVRINVTDDIDISGGLLSASTFGQGNSGSIDIVADSFTLRDQGQILTATYGVGNSGSQDQTSVSIKACNVNLTNGGQVSSETSWTGSAGDIRINAYESMVISGSNGLYYSGLYSNTYGPGNSGRIIVIAPTLYVDNEGAIQTGVFGDGNAADQTGYAIDLTVNTLSISGGGQVASSSQGSGNAGNIQINATQHIYLSGFSNYYTSGIFADSYWTGNSGSISIFSPELYLQLGSKISNTTYYGSTAGDISIDVQKMSLSSDAMISSAGNGTSEAGNIEISASESVSISGLNQENFYGGIYSSSYESGPGGNISITTPALSINQKGIIQAATFGSGDAGNISFNTNTLNMDSGARVSASTGGSGSAGSIEINAGESIIVNGRYGDYTSGIFALSGEDIGKGGDIIIRTPNLSLSKDSRIEASTAGLNNAGDISLSLGRLTLTNGALIVSQSTGEGDAGNIQISVDDFVQISGSGSLNNSGIAVNAHSSGDGGQALINTTDLTLKDGGAIEAATSGQGSGGSIVINSNTLNLSGDSWISSRSSATSTQDDPSFVPGEAGSIQITAKDTIEMSNSKITTRTEDADGGNIIINAGNLLHLDNSFISTSVAGGQGNGGNISIDPVFVILNNSDIIANAYEGSGGNISLTADYLFVWPDSRIEASSQLGVDGAVEIASPEIDLSSSLVVLPDSGTTAELSQDSCATRRDEDTSSLVVNSRGGMPQSPEDPMVGNGPI